jgi:uncharacterized protein YkwD
MYRYKRVIDKTSNILIIIWLITIIFFFIIIILSDLKEYSDRFNFISNKSPYFPIIMQTTIITGITTFIAGIGMKLIYGISFLFKRRKRLSQIIFAAMSILLTLTIFGVLIIWHTFNKNEYKVQQADTKKIKEKIMPSPSVDEYLLGRLSPRPLTSEKPVKKYEQNNTKAGNEAEPEEWGVAKQINEVTWTMKIGYDDRMATAQEIFEALNTYRQRHGTGSLTWDDNLAEYAQSRAGYFSSIGTTDKHAGFNEYIKNEENLKKLGFWGVGENASYGYRLYGVHIIEWIYAGDEPHDKNQRDPNWTHVGVGVSGTETALIFGKWKM